MKLSKTSNGLHRVLLDDGSDTKHVLRQWRNLNKKSWSVYDANGDYVMFHQYKTLKLAKENLANIVSF